MEFRLHRIVGEEYPQGGRRVAEDEIAATSAGHSGKTVGSEKQAADTASAAEAVA